MAFYQVDFQKTIESAFLTYAGEVAQNRALVDVRDGLKPGLRQGLYAQSKKGLTSSKPFKKAQISVSAGMELCYVHGDAALYELLVRTAKPWVMRYMLEEVDGSRGTIQNVKTHPASRYIGMRSSPLADIMTEGLKKRIIPEADWYSNFDDTEMIPNVFPSIGFWNLINGTMGISVGLASSIPQFNLREVNEAIIKVIQNPEIAFEEIYCAPDFATGSTVINGSEVKESLRVGEGKAVKLRATIKYDVSTHSLEATEIPFGVYTDTIMEELAELTEADPNYGIERVLDDSKETSRMIIYLSKGAKPQQIIQKLYKDTSLENFIGINMTMLEDGRFPRVFGWKQAIQSYIKHIEACKRRELTYDLEQLYARQHIIEGLLVAVANIDEVVAIIRSSEDTADAKNKLCSKFKFSDLQVKAILDLKLQRLINIEYIKLQDELEEVNLGINNLKRILSSQEEINQILINRLKEVAAKYGDKRRTKIEENMVVEDGIFVPQIILLSLTNIGKIYCRDSIAGPGYEKAKEIIIDKIVLDNTKTIYALSNLGTIYTFPEKFFIVGKDYLPTTTFDLAPNEIIVRIFDDNIKNIIYITKNGLVKKTSLTDLATKRKAGLNGIKLKEGDSIAISLPIEQEDTDLVLITSRGYYNRYETSLITTTGRAGVGIKAINLKDGDYVAGADLVKPNDKFIITISAKGQVKKIAVQELTKTGRAKRGTYLHKTSEEHPLVYVKSIKDEKSLIAASNISYTHLFVEPLTSIKQGSQILDNLIYIGPTRNT